jgi:hypothetical protein
MMARITDDRLVQHLQASGFALMKGPPSDDSADAAWPGISRLKESRPQPVPAVPGNFTHSPDCALRTKLVQRTGE